MRRSTLALLIIIPLTGLLALAAGIALGQDDQPDAGSVLTNDGISYQGYLTDADGNPLSGDHNLKFAIYNKPNSGDLLWQKTYNNTPVQDGLIDIILDVDTGDFNGQALWLAISVDGQLLSPRKELLPVPYALSVRPGAEMAGNLNKAILKATNKGTGPGLAGLTEDDTEWEAAGVYGRSVHGSTFGVLGESEWGIGIEARIGNPDNDSAALVGFTEGGGEGIVGYSAGFDGMAGFSSNSDAVGGRFQNDAAGGVGAYAKAGDTETPDLILGGESSEGNQDDGILASDPELPSSDIVLRSNDATAVVLDANEDEDGEFVILKPDGEALFIVDEEGNTDVQGDLTVQGNLNAGGSACVQYGPYTEGHVYNPPVPQFCIDQFCWIIMQGDAIFGAFRPGLYWPVLYMQNSADNSWVGGPAIDLAGMTVGHGMGNNGNEYLEIIAPSGITTGGGRMLLWDDGAGDHSPDTWYLDFTPKPEELTTVTVYVCPMGQPQVP